MYTKEEIKQIQELFSRKRIPSEKDDSLKEKILKDEKAKTYGYYGFFPETYDMVYNSDVLPEIYFDGESRGTIALIKNSNKKVAIKPLQNSRENEIAKIAGDLGIGPKQFDTLDGFLTEEFIEGELFSRLTKENLSDDNIYILGKRVGEILLKLHSNDIYYNDTILTNDLGKSHLFVPNNKSAMLFDYGKAIRLDKFPKLSDEEIFNYAVTLPLVNMSLYLEEKLTKEKRNEIVNKFKSILLGSKEQIMQRDLDFISEGLYFANGRLGKDITEPFLKGFKETYIN